MKDKKFPIVILHGWNLSGNRFQPLITAFKHHGFEVFAPDLPGFGAQPVPTKTLGLSDYATFVEKFLNTNNIKQCILIGHSFGGRIAVLFTALYAKRVHALILTGAPIFPPVPAIKTYAFWVLAKIGKIIFSIPILSFIAKPMQKMLYRLTGSSDYYYAKDTMRKTFLRVIAEDLLQYFTAISVPMLLLWGEKDLITPPWIAKKAHRIKPESKLIIIPNERHMAAVNQPQDFVNHVISFLEHI